MSGTQQQGIETAIEELDFQILGADEPIVDEEEDTTGLKDQACVIVEDCIEPTFDFSVSSDGLSIAFTNQKGLSLYKQSKTLSYNSIEELKATHQKVLFVHLVQSTGLLAVVIKKSHRVGSVVKFFDSLGETILKEVDFFTEILKLHGFYYTLLVQTKQHLVEYDMLDQRVIRAMTVQSFVVNQSCRIYSFLANNTIEVISSKGVCSLEGVKNVKSWAVNSKYLAVVVQQSSEVVVYSVPACKIIGRLHRGVYVKQIEAMQFFSDNDFGLISASAYLSTLHLFRIDQSLFAERVKIESHTKYKYKNFEESKSSFCARSSLRSELRFNSGRVLLISPIGYSFATEPIDQPRKKVNIQISQNSWWLIK